MPLKKFFYISAKLKNGVWGAHIKCVGEETGGFYKFFKKTLSPKDPEPKYFVAQ